MKSAINPLFLLLLAFSGLVSGRPLGEIKLVTPTPNPVLDTSYFKETCQSSRPFSIVCGDQFCDSETGYITQFREPHDSYSYSHDYNLAAYILFFVNNEYFCVDESILQNPDAGYGINELDNVDFSGILKIENSLKGNMVYAPFKTRLKRSEEVTSRDIAKYQFTISSLWALEPIKDTDYFYAATDWLSVRNRLNWVINNQDDSDEIRVRLPSSELTLTLERSSILGGRAYDATITGQIETPYHNKISIPFKAQSIRFARPGFSNFRKDIRYQWSASFLPENISAFYKMRHEPFRILEMILFPGDCKDKCAN